MSRHEVTTDDAHECEPWMLRDHVDGVAGLKYCGACGALRVIWQGEPTRHASCDCRSYQAHYAIYDGPNHPPLATVLTERHQAELWMGNLLARRCPWLTGAQIAAIIAWQPGQPLAY